MKQNKTVPHAIKVFPIPIPGLAVVFAELFGLGFNAFLIYLLVVQNLRGIDLFVAVSLIVAMSIAMIYIFIASVKLIFSRITIDETGVSRAFLGKFFKLHISWDEMAETCFMFVIMLAYGYIWFSKTKKISKIPAEKRHKVKDSIVISLSKKRYAVIKQYIKQPIVGLSEEDAKRIKLV